MRYRVIALTLPLAFSLSGLLATRLAAQDSPDTSVADAARRAKEQKQSVPKPVKVITNDNLPAAPKPETPAGTQPASSPDAAQPAADTATVPAASTDAKAPGDAATNPEVVALKRQIADQQKEVDLLLRLYSLDQDAFLSSPDHAKDLQGKAKLDAQQEEIHAKVAAVAALKAKLDAIAPDESTKAPPPPKP